MVVGSLHHKKRVGEQTPRVLKLPCHPSTDHKIAFSSIQYELAPYYAVLSAFNLGVRHFHLKYLVRKKIVIISYMIAR